MKKHVNIIISAVLALLLGLALGSWFSSGKDAGEPLSEQHDHAGETVLASQGEEIWTCSMHPQIRQNEPGECPICGMDLIPLSENTSNDPLVLEMTDEAVKMANIQTSIIGRESTPDEAKVIRLNGKVQADERLAASQPAHVPGRIEQLFVTFTGEPVYKGQKLAILYSPELVAAQQELLEGLRLRATNPKLVESARAKLRYWKISEEAIDAIEKTGQIQENFTVYADATGVVTNRRISVGDYVKQGEALFDLMNLSRVWVLFDAYEQDLANISVGDRIEFTTPAIPNRTFSSRITFIDPVINPKTRVASLRTEVSNPKGLLKPEMLVYGSSQNKPGADAVLTVPKSAVLWTGTRSVVYVKVPDTTIPSYQFREVALGERLGDQYEILDGLESGEEVVTYGSFAIDAAAQLNNQASMMNKDVMLRGSDHQDHLPDYTDQTPVAFKQQVTDLTKSYLLLKDAFVNSDADQAATAAIQVETALNSVDMSLLTGAAHNYWMEQLNALRAHSQKISQLSEIAAQREQFDFLSQALINTVKVFGIVEGTYYVQHCPMAIDNKGADWISTEESIRNPYFGEQMLTCGAVEVTIDKEFKNPSTQLTAAPTPPNTHNH
ncbi:MAG: efflux RND transporter periplasmic adaptor subunit [Saprospiraceae bacterium]|nr:efflux RND transporter periplasmic adaptor subunit [Lewinella sp.]